MERISQCKRSGIAIFATFIAGIALSVCLVASHAQPAYAVTAAEKAAEAQEALNELYAMQDTLQKASAKYYQSLAEYQQAVERRDIAQINLDDITEKLKSVQSSLDVRARDMYRNGSTSFVDLLLGASSFDEFTLNWDLLVRVNSTYADLVKDRKELRAKAETQKTEFDRQANVAEQKSVEASEAFRESERLVAQMEETYNNLSKEAQELYEQEQAAAAQAAVEAAAAAQAEAAAEAAETVETPTEGGIQNEDGTVTDAETGQVYQSASEYSSATGNEIVDRAMSMLGASYQYGATGENGAFDCSGLVGYALTGSYERIGNTTTFMGYNQVSDPQPGDIAVNEGHTGIYIGNGQMVHASDESTGVIVGNVQSGMIYVRP